MTRYTTLRQRLSLCLVLVSMLAGVPVSVAWAAPVPAPSSIKVVLDDNYPPYSFRDEQGQPQGILRDMWTLWAQRTGIQVDFQPMDWGKARATMERGDADVIDTIFQTPERERIYAFSGPYASIDVAVFFDQAIGGISDENSLRGFTVGVKEGDACIEHLNRFGITTLKTYPSYEAEVAAAAAREVRVLCIDKPAGLYFLNRAGIAGEYRITRPLYTGQFHRAVAKGNDALLTTLEAGFAHITPAERETIEQKWLGTAAQGSLAAALERYGLYGLALVVLAVIVLLLWNRMLRRRVEVRTQELTTLVQSLENSERRFRTLFEQATDAMFIMNNWVLIDCNHSAEILYGLPHARLIGTSPLGLAPECQPDGTSSVALLEAMDARVRRGEAVNFVWRQERHDGVVLDVDVSLNALIYEGIACTQAIVRDVTEKLQQQALLREVTALQSAILESAAVSIISTTPDGLITSFNRGAENMLGYRAEEMVQRVTPALIHMPDEVVARAQELSTELGVSLEPGFDVFVIRSRLGLPNAYEWTYVRKDGSLLPVLLTISTLTDQQGVTVGYLGIATDISANKKVEAELLNLKERAEAANQAKSQFLATMSHEIRTPLNGVLGMAQLLLMPDIAEQERQEYARTILHSGQTLLTLLNDILDLSKIEAGKMEIAATVFEPGHLVEETTALFAQLAQTKGLTLDTDWHCPQGARYKADSARLRQMLSNLIGNAIKFTPRGFVRIEASEIERKENHALLEFSVTDSGIGIPPDKQDILFQPFSQVDSSTTREFGGTGLGLSIIRSLAKLMGGEVGVASEVGKGSRFWFRIQADILLKGEDSRHVERSAEFKPDTQATAGGTEFVLVVEDNPTNRKVVEALLGKLGIQVKSVENGQEAVDGIRQGLRPSLILMDIQMPVMDGLKATQLIRRGEEESGQPHLVIIALTAGAFEEDRQRCIDAGMDDFLTKPISIRDLESVLAKWMVKDKQTENLT